MPLCAPSPYEATVSGFNLAPRMLNLRAVSVPAADAVQSASAEPADEALMLAYGRGDVAAFDLLYDRHRQRLYRFLLRELGDRALADEIYQDVWQRVIAARAGWRPEAGFAAWLYRIARNRVADHWRAARHRPPAPEDADARLARVPDDDTPEHRMASDERSDGLRRALAALPAEQREVVLLRLEQELTLEEIGALTGAGRETVKSRLRYAMDKLRAAMTP